MSNEVEAVPAVISIAGAPAQNASIAVIDGDTIVPEAIDAVEAEGIAEAAEEVAATVADSAVEIAQIEADASVAIAETNAAVEIARIEATSDSDTQYVELRERNTWLEAELANTQEQNRELMAQLATLSTPQPSPETMVIADDPETMTVISATGTETSSLTPMEVPVENVEENPVAEAILAKARRKVRLL